MSEVKILHLVGQSTESWEAAVQNVLREASTMVENIETIYIKEFLAVVQDAKIANFHVNAKITFLG